MTIELHIPTLAYVELKRHLLPPQQKNEEAAFVFAQVSHTAEKVTFTYKDLRKLGSDDYKVQLPYHFELTDDTQASLIKKAHELNASIFEFHSHLDSDFAQFSFTDWQGFREFVPHVFWRLKKKPYGAIVVTKKGFDALVWVDDPQKPQSLTGLIVGDQTFIPSNLSIEEHYGEAG